MLPAISDFLKTNFVDNFLKLLQPASLIAAFIFVILNAAFIFPGLAERNTPLTAEFLHLDAVWQAVLVAAIVLVLSYLLLSFNSSIYKLMTGESWQRSPLLGQGLIKLQKQERDYLEQLKGKAIEKQQDLTAFKAWWEEITRFPKYDDPAINSDDYFRPTAFGNVLNATASYVWNHYHIDMTALWPQIQTILTSDSNNALAKRIDDEKATLDFLVYLTLILILFAVEYVLVQFFFLHEGAIVLWFLLPLVLAFIVYRGAVSKARIWGDEVQMAFDTYRDKLSQALGLRPFKSHEDECQVWEKVSTWLLFGTTTKDVNEVFSGKPAFVPPTPPDASVTASDNVKVTLKSAVTTIEMEEGTSNPVSGREIKQIYQNIDYVILISNVETDVHKHEVVADGVYVLVSDPRVLIDADNPPVAEDGNGKNFHVKVMPANAANAVHQLLWCIDSLPPNGSAALCYQLPSHMLKATTNYPASLLLTLQTQKEGKTITYRFTIQNKGAGPLSEAKLKVFDNRSPPPPKALNSINQGIPTKRSSQSDSYYWDLGSLTKDQVITLKYSLIVDTGG